jgi:putative membrane protein
VYGFIVDKLDKGDTNMTLKGLLQLIFVLVVLVFGSFIGSLNTHLVVINYLLAEPNVPLWAVLAIAFSLGFLVCMVFSLVYILRIRLRISSLERQNIKLSRNKLVK